MLAFSALNLNSVFTQPQAVDAVNENDLGWHAKSGLEALDTTGTLADLLADSPFDAQTVEYLGTAFALQLPQGTAYRLQVTRFSPKTEAGQPVANCTANPTLAQCFDYNGCLQMQSGATTGASCVPDPPTDENKDLYTGRYPAILLSAYAKNSSGGACTIVDQDTTGELAKQETKGIARLQGGTPSNAALDFNVGVNWNAGATACDTSDADPNCGPLYCSQTVHATLMTRNTARNPIAVSSIVDTSGSMGPLGGLDMNIQPTVIANLSAGDANYAKKLPANCDFDDRDLIKVADFNIVDADADGNPEIQGSVLNSELENGNDAYQVTVSYSVMGSFPSSSTCINHGLVLKYLEPGSEYNNTYGLYKGYTSTTTPHTPQYFEYLYRQTGTDSQNIVRSNNTIRLGKWGVFVWSDREIRVTNVNFRKYQATTNIGLLNSPINVGGGFSEGAACDTLLNWQPLQTVKSVGTPPYAFNKDAASHSLWARYKNPGYTYAGNCGEPRLRFRRVSDGNIYELRYPASPANFWTSYPISMVGSTEAFILEAWSDYTFTPTIEAYEYVGNTVTDVLNVPTDITIKLGRWWFNPSDKSCRTLDFDAINGNPNPVWTDAGSFTLDNFRFSPGQDENAVVDAVVYDFNQYGCAPQIRVVSDPVAGTELITPAYFQGAPYSQRQYQNVRIDNTTHYVQVLGSYPSPFKTEIRLSTKPAGVSRDGFNPNRLRSNVNDLAEDPVFTYASTPPTNTCSPIDASFDFQSIGALDINNTPPFVGMTTSTASHFGLVVNYNAPGVGNFFSPCPDSILQGSYYRNHVTSVCKNTVTPTLYAPKFKFELDTGGGAFVTRAQGDMNWASISFQTSDPYFCQDEHSARIELEGRYRFSVWSDIDLPLTATFPGEATPLYPYLKIYNNRWQRASGMATPNNAFDLNMDCNAPLTGYRLIEKTPGSGYSFEITPDQNITSVYATLGFTGYSGGTAASCAFGPQLRLQLPNDTNIDTFRTPADSNCLAAGASSGTCKLHYQNPLMTPGQYKVYAWSPINLNATRTDVNFSRLDIAQDALKLFFAHSNWKDEDRLQLTRFSSDATEVEAFGNATGAFRNQLGASAEALTPGGQTNICAALTLATQKILIESLARYIILLTDGITNVPCEPNNPAIDDLQEAGQEAQQAADNARANGITIYTIGFGRDVNANQLGRIACDTDYNAQCATNLYAGEYYFASDAASLTAIYQLIASEIGTPFGNADIKMPLNAFRIDPASVRCTNPADCGLDSSTTGDISFTTENGIDYVVFNNANIAKTAPDWWKGEFDFVLDCNGQYCDTNNLLIPPPGTVISVTSDQTYDWNKRLAVNYRYADLNVSLYGARLVGNQLFLDLSINNSGLADLNSDSNELFNPARPFQMRIIDESNPIEVPVRIDNAQLPTSYQADLPFGDNEPDLNFYHLVPYDGAQFPTPLPDRDLNIAVQQLNGIGRAGLCQRLAAPFNCTGIQPDSNILLRNVTFDRVDRFRIEINPNGNVPECRQHNSIQLSCASEPRQAYYLIDYWVWRE